MRAPFARPTLRVHAPWALLLALACGEGVLDEINDKLDETDTDTLVDSESDLETDDTVQPHTDSDTVDDSETDATDASDTEVETDSDSDVIPTEDPCANDPCGLVATCEAVDASFVCLCPAPYAGPNCDQCDPRQLCGDPWVFLEGDFSTDGINEVFGRPLAGNPAAARVLGPFDSGGGVQSWKISADGTFLVGTAKANTSAPISVFTSPARAPNLRKVSQTFVAGGAALAPVSSTFDGRVVYFADADIDGRFDMHAVGQGGGSATRLNDAFASGGDLGPTAAGPRLSPDGRWALYAGEARVSRIELFAVPVNRSVAPARLSPTVHPSAEVLQWYVLTPDSTRVVYGGDLDVVNIDELYVQPADGSTPPRKLHEDLVLTQNVRTVRISPDGRYAVFVGNLDAVNDELFVVPLDGSWPRKAINPFVPAQGQITTSLWITPDSQRVLFRAKFAPTDGKLGLYSVPITGGTTVQLSRTGTIDDAVATQVLISPDSQWAVYLADHDVSQTNELYAVRTDGSAPAVRLHAPLVNGEDVTPDFVITSTSTTVVYRVNLDHNSRHELWSATLSATPVITRLSPVPADEGSVRQFAVSPEGDSVVYVADQDVRDQVEAYRRAVSGGAAPVKVSPSLGADQDVVSVQIGMVP